MQFGHVAVVDSRGDKYVLKFDGPGWYESASAAEVITTKFFYASGYNVPENHIFFFHPSQLTIGPKVTVPSGNGKKRKMTKEDLAEMLDSQPKRKDGKIRCVASKWLSGVPVGPFHFHGRRKDDLNDRVEYDDRRELRGLRILSSWLGDTDRRMANTLDMYVTDENQKSYVKHFLIDMGSTIGSNWGRPHPPKYGNEYAVDIVNIGKAFLMAGYYEDSWDSWDYSDSMHYESVGWYESEMFDQEGWVSVYPNPAIENMTLRDAYLGTRIVASFTDEDIKTIVGTGILSNPDAEAYLIKTLIERRDKIVSYWFSRMNPVDRFEIIKNTDSLIFRFSDLAVDAGVSNPDESSYMVNVTGSFDEESQEFILTKPLSINFKQFSASSDNGHNYKITIKTRRGNRAQWSKKVTIFIAYRDDSNSYEIVSVKRDS